MKSELKKIKGTTVNAGPQKILLKDYFYEGTSPLTQTKPSSTTSTTPPISMIPSPKSTASRVPPPSTGSTTKRTTPS